MTDRRAGQDVSFVHLIKSVRNRHRRKTAENQVHFEPETEFVM